MTSDALILAALAAAAVPGLRAERAELVAGRPGDRFTVCFVTDAEQRRWVVRLPVDAVSAAQQDAAVALLGLLGRRVPFAVPAPKGFAALRDGRRAMAYPMISGAPLAWPGLPSGPGLAADVGRSLAALHNVDRRLVEEAGLPSYEAEECRRRHLVELDRAAGSGVVPAGLLARWESMLDDVSRWRFAPTPVHGRVAGSDVLAGFADGDDASSGRVRAVLGWERAHVGDPAQDLANLLAQAPADAADSVLEAYAMSRVDRPDPHLEWRARLLAELATVSDLLAATSTKDRHAIATATQAVRDLAGRIGDPEIPPAPALPIPAADVVAVRPGRDDRLYRGGSLAPEPGPGPAQPGTVYSAGGTAPSSPPPSSPPPSSAAADIAPGPEGNRRPGEVRFDDEEWPT